MIAVLRTFAFSLLLLGVSLLCLFLTLLYFVQEKLIFVPSPLPANFVFDFHQPFTERVFTFSDAGDSDRIDTLFFSAHDLASGHAGGRASSPRPLILYFHGNAGQLATWGGIAGRIAAETGAAVWILDYPGFGKSTGTIHAESQLEQLADQFYEMGETEALSQHRPLILFGRALGSGLVTRLAALHAGDPELAGVILEAPFYRYLSVAKRQVPFVPSALLHYQFPNHFNLKKVAQPVLILHGTDDDVIPLENSQALVARSLPTARLIEIEGGKHDNLADSTSYWIALSDFLGRLRRPETAPARHR